MPKPICYITIGIPNSGKTYWANNQKMPVLSCDDLRNQRNPGKKYIFDPKIEKEIWNDFYSRLGNYTKDFIICNTNCRLHYINEIKKHINPSFEIKYVWFEEPMWKIHFRNYKRWLFEDKWIPKDVLKNMKENFDKLKKEWKNV